MGTRNNDAVLGCQPNLFGGRHTQRVYRSVEEVDLQHVDFCVTFDDIDQCLQDCDLGLGIELASHLAQVFAEIR